MQISARADYAVRALVELAADGARPLTCEAVAAAQGIPFRFLKSVFRDLCSAGHVRSRRGCEGGYRLGRDADAIAVDEVMAAVDGEFFTVRGERPEDLAYPGAGAGVRQLWRDAESAAHTLLGRTTIADLVRGGTPGRVDEDGAVRVGTAAAPT